MKIAVVNLKDTDHTICTTTGSKIVIRPNNYTILECETDRDISFWTGLSDETLNRYGLKVVVDEKDILELDSRLSDILYKDSSIADGFVSPVAKQIADSIQAGIKKETESEPTKEESTDDIGCYKESELLQMNKEDLFNLCDNFNIKYKRNNSVKTLVNLLKESGVVLDDTR